MKDEEFADIKINWLIENKNYTRGKFLKTK